MKLNELKLKDLDLILSKQTHLQMMVRLLGFKNNWFNRTFRFRKPFYKLNTLLVDVGDYDPSVMNFDIEEISIKIPTAIDLISFAAFLTLQAEIESEELDYTEKMKRVIAIYSFSSNCKLKFDLDSFEFKVLMSKINYEPAMQMVSLYNLIIKQLKDTATYWNQLFFDVQVFNQDMDNAGQERSKPFNVVNTVKAICRDFNVTYEEAWFIEYGVVQTANLASATDNKIQDDLRILKENKMKAQRRT